MSEIFYAITDIPEIDGKVVKSAFFTCEMYHKNVHLNILFDDGTRRTIRVDVLPDVQLRWHRDLQMAKKITHLQQVRCLWELGETRVADVYIVNARNPNKLLANTDGYDDWAHVIKYAPGEYNGEAYDYCDIGVC